MRKIVGLFLLVSISTPLLALAGSQGVPPPDILILKFDLQPNLMRERRYTPGDMSDMSPRMSKGYLRSELTVRNVGTRTAYLVDWDYFLTDPNSGREVACYHFRARQTIKPDRKATLRSVVDESRDTEQNRKTSERYARKRFHARVEITLIEYLDGTSWQAPLIDKSAQGNVQLSSSGKAPRAPELKKPENAADLSQPRAAATSEYVEENDILRIDTRLVTVPVIATDSRGAYVTDLQAEEFHAYEDGVEQKIALISQVEKPFFVVLLLDMSGSIGQTLDKLKREAIAFVDQLKPNDYVFVVTFDTEIHSLHEKATNDHKVLRDAIMSAQLGNSTSLLDAVLTISSRILRPVPGRKALILFTDGGENASIAGTKKNTLHDAEELDALIYVVQYYPFRETDYLKALVEGTGGRLYRGTDEKKIRQAFVSLAEELRHQYAVSYYPSPPSLPGQTHNVRVVVKRAGVHVKSRKTYRVRQ